MFELASAPTELQLSNDHPSINIGFPPGPRPRSFMRKHILIFAAFLTFVCVGPSLAQTDWSKVEIKSTKVSGNVYMLEGAGGNIGVSVGPDGILIVDDQYAPLADKIKAALKTLGEGKLKFVLNTHWHADHTGSNAAFGPEAPVIAHDNVRKRLSTEQRSEFFKRTTPPSPREALPIITFGHSLTVHFNGEEIRVIHFPQGHTDGDSIIFFTNSNVVHMGDHFFAGRFPFVDLEWRQCCGLYEECCRRNREAS